MAAHPLVAIAFTGETITGARILKASPTRSRRFPGTGRQSEHRPPMT
jgi:hypothetical protein